MAAEISRSLEKWLRRYCAAYAKSGLPGGKEMPSNSSIIGWIGFRSVPCVDVGSYDATGKLFQLTTNIS